MLVILLGMETFVRFAQPENTPLLIALIEFGIEMLIKDEQSAKAFSSIKLTFGIEILERPVQPANELFPIVMQPGTDILVKLLQP